MEVFECTRCGKDINPLKGVYGIALSESRPEDDRLFPGEGVLWESQPYCSRECLENSMNQIRSELMSWLQEENWAQLILDRMRKKR